MNHFENAINRISPRIGNIILRNFIGNIKTPFWNYYTVMINWMANACLEISSLDPQHQLNQQQVQNRNQSPN